MTTLTVLPLRPGRVDRAAAGVAMAVTPAVGGVLGAAAGGVLAATAAAGLSPLLGSVAAVGTLALLTRGLHLDGLADTADGFGVPAAPPERALAVMRSPEIGPFGAAALVLVLLGQAAAGAQTAAAGPWVRTVAVLALGTAAGRLALPWSCRRGVPAARPDGLGALVAGTVPSWVCLAWTVLLAAVAVPVRGWPGGLAVAVAVGVALVLVAAVRRRLGGVTGDTLGAAVELATLAAWAVLAG